MKRVMLLIATNLAVMVLLSIVISILGIDQALAREGLQVMPLLVMASIFGFGGAFISLLISKPMAKWSTGARVIDGTEGSSQYWLLETVRRLAERAAIAMPEVAIYEGEPNAFATGAFRNSALVAVSTGLLESMSRDEVEAVLGHEIGHVANGDMVTLTLIQGVVNTFVIFLSRVIGYVVDRMILKNERGYGIGYFVAVTVSQIVLGILASIVVAWFSRRREFRADAASAELLGSPQPMVNALARLGGLQPGALPASFQASGISNAPGWMSLLSSHPPIEERIAALQARGAGRV
ncbi:MAG: zinc metalloprotease HtpX [Betaproteobacteria bacterium RIFCSPLOWO2_12_FULL_67_28]|nr:MAG: zinc metalloprotease HtpX [Betaproteobacteria bacterium RIFCSPLOWO2_02_FULL_68_150]OGA69248.1 MAG: zinc metalloprotease HtpX [Betaproteobacteria bacterium RIFCSPLOWO2_12_FULL_67_28]